jgi:hypothetical protein
MKGLKVVKVLTTVNRTWVLLPTTPSMALVARKTTWKMNMDLI